MAQKEIYAAVLAATTNTARKRQADETDQRRKKIIDTIITQLLKDTKHAAQKGQEFCVMDFPEYKQDDDNVAWVAKNTLPQTLIMHGFNGREIQWAYQPGGIKEQQAEGRHLMVTVAWNQPLSEGEIRELLNPANAAP